MTATKYHHIELDADGIALIRDANTKVVELVAEKLAYAWDADELKSQHPNLTLSQIHSALAYYYDHQQEIDADLDRRLARADAIISAQGPALSVRAKLLDARRRQ